MIDYTLILIRKYKGSQWTLNGDDYSGLSWLSETPKPSKSALDNLWQETIAEIEAEKVSNAALKQAILNKLGVTAEELAQVLS